MPASTLALVSVPTSLVVGALLLRHGPSAVLTLIAGIVAVLAAGKRGDRALAVLRLLRTTSNTTRGRKRQSDGGQTRIGPVADNDGRS